MRFGLFPLSPGRSDAAIYVHPGRIAVSLDGAILTTVAGSGLVLCLRDPIRGIGGMAHFLLPEAGSAPPEPRHGDVAMRMLVDELVKAGAATSILHGRIYGGGVPPVDSASGHVGERNVSAAFGFVRSRGITVVECDVGGRGFRKILFGPRRGAAEVTRVQA